MSTMLDMQNEMRQRFRQKSAWETVADSEMVGQLADLLGTVFYETMQEVETARQDAFLTTATTRAAVLAHASDRGYLPPRPTPPSGVVTLSNQSTTTSVTVPAHFQLLDNEGVSYHTEDEVTIAPATSVNVAVQQLQASVLTLSLIHI